MDGATVKFVKRIPELDKKSDDFKGEIKNGKLEDLAPTILHFMGIEIPKEMTGEVVV